MDTGNLNIISKLTAPIINKINDNITLNAFRIAIDASRSIFNMVDGIVDYFVDETGIDTAASTNEDYDSANDLYSPTSTAGLDVSPFAHYKCNDNVANTVVTDDGTGANNGVANVNTSNYSVAGKINDAFDFNGSEFVNLDALTADIETDTTGSFSIWINPDDVGTRGFFFALSNSAGVTALRMSIDQNARLDVEYFSNGPFEWRHVGVGTFSNGTWYHIIIVQDGVSPKVYVDTVDVTDLIVTTDTTFWLADLVTPDVARLGCENLDSGGNTRFFNGQVDDFRYYQNKVLTQSEIDLIYNSGSGSEADQFPGATDNMTLISDTFTAEAEPDDARIVILQEDVDAVTINTDLKAYITRDAGQTFTTDFGTDDKLDITSHGFVNDDRIMVTSSSQDLPAGLDSATVYYVINKTTNDFELSLTSSGSAVDITDNGTGTHTAKKVNVVTLSDDGNFDASKRILTGSVDISGQPSGTSMEYSIETANNKDLKIHSTALNWE